jgi:hypothetical protein
LLGVEQQVEQELLDPGEGYADASIARLLDAQPDVVARECDGGQVCADVRRAALNGVRLREEPPIFAG